VRQRPSRFQRRTPQDPRTRRDQFSAFADSESAWLSPEWFDNVTVVLMETTDAVNIGGVVRAMANTGFSRLRLVRPADFDPWQITGVAHYTQHILNGVRLFDALSASVADAHFVLGLTGAHHRVARNQLALADAVGQVVEAAREGQTVAVVFGREDFGLSNAMLDACHAVTTIPTHPGHSSLNLAQAALLFLYQVFQRAGGEQQEFRPPRRSAPPAPSGLLEDLFADLERALIAIDFLGSRSPVATMRSLRVALYRARLDVREASLLRAIAIEVRRFLHRRGVLSEVGPVGTRDETPADLTPP
jgi:tRNA (cytidine32/uridine32-2'-O)-methyltransferase